ncbi:MAG: hypothetical protein V4661_12425 [Pseudomonadota bacterium]
MVPGGVTEVVWHFAGYLQIINDIARDRIDYDEFAFRNLTDDYITPRPNYASKPDIDELDSHGIRVPGMSPFEELTKSYILPIKSFSPRPPQPDFEFDSQGGLPRFFAPRSGGGGGGGQEIKITVEYQDDGDQIQLDIRQHNFMWDDDSLLVSADGSNLPCDTTSFSAHAEAALQRMADSANDQIPEQWSFPQNGTGVTEFVKAHDADLASRDGPGAHSVEPGYYLNGVLQVPAPDPPYQTPAPEPEPAPDLGQDLGQWAEAGANDSFNAALIVDLSESGRSMIVMGDYFKTDAIFQTNSTMDSDHIEAGGGQALATVTGENRADNIADFVHNPGIYDSLLATFAGPRWNVDVVEGDYYNVHTIVQFNYLIDNDVVVQWSGDTHYEAHSGENQLGNLAEVFGGTVEYDLIIVVGAYHGMNVIFQNNILLNNDLIKLLMAGTDPSQSVVSGQNELANTATIETYGDDNFQPMNDDLNSLVTAISEGQTILDPSYGKYIDGSGGVFDVLYVKGDYYDINAIWQTNVTADMNLIIQLLEAPSAAALNLHPDGTETQSVTSGKNSLSNDAAIVDVGATNTYVNGEVYGDTILVQANLLPVNDPTLTQDMHALVPELIAFVNDSQDEAPAATQVASVAVHEDPIASVMQ